MYKYKKAASSLSVQNNSNSDVFGTNVARTFHKNLHLLHNFIFAHLTVKFAFPLICQLRNETKLNVVVFTNTTN